MSWTKSVRMSAVKKVLTPAPKKEPFSTSVILFFFSCERISADAHPANPPPIIKIFIVKSDLIVILIYSYNEF